MCPSLKTTLKVLNSEILYIKDYFTVFPLKCITVKLDHWFPFSERFFTGCRKKLSKYFVACFEFTLNLQIVEKLSKYFVVSFEFTLNLEIVEKLPKYFVACFEFTLNLQIVEKLPNSRALVDFGLLLHQFGPN